MPISKSSYLIQGTVPFCQLTKFIDITCFNRIYNCAYNNNANNKNMYA